MTGILNARGNSSEIINVYLFAGQSNALGRANIESTDPLLTNTLSNGGLVDNNILYHHNYRGSSTLESNGFLTLGPRPSDDGQNGNFGPELTFGRDIQNAYPDTRIAILKYAVGGTDLNTQWKAGGTSDSTGDGQYYMAFKQLVDNGMARLQSENPDATISIRAMIWHQGENDVISSPDNYKTNLARFISDVRQTFGISHLPFIIGGMSDLQTAADLLPANMAKVRQAQIDVANEDPYTYFVSLDAIDGLTISADKTHFDANGYKVMGERFASTVITATPEPGTLTILGLGLVNLLRRNRK